MSAEITYLPAYRNAIFRGSRERPVWDPADTAEFFRSLRTGESDALLEAKLREQQAARQQARVQAMRAMGNQGATLVERAFAAFEPDPPRPAA